MTHDQHITYLKMAFQCLDLGFTTEQIETIILTTQAVKNKKCRFSMMDAAKIKAAMYDKYTPKPEPEIFDDYETLGNDRQ